MLTFYNIVRFGDHFFQVILEGTYISSTLRHYCLLTAMAAKHLIKCNVANDYLLLKSRQGVTNTTIFNEKQE